MGVSQLSDINNIQNGLSHKGDRKIIEGYIPIAEYISAVCGPRYEVVLHDLTDFDHTIVYIANSITDRKVGDSLLTMSLDIILDSENTSQKNFVANVCRNTNIKGKKLRMSDFYIRNEDHEVIGLFSINIDITPFDSLEQLLKEEAGLQQIVHGQNTNYQEIYDSNILPLTSMIEKTFDLTMHELAFSDAKNLSPEERIQLLSVLYNKNLFIMKGTVPLIAKKMNVSASTVYRYLQTIKQASNHKRDYL